MRRRENKRAVTGQEQVTTAIGQVRQTAVKVEENRIWIGSQKVKVKEKVRVKAKVKIKAKVKVKVNVTIAVSMDTWRATANNQGYSRVIVTIVAGTAMRPRRAQQLKEQAKVARVKEPTG